MCTSCGLAASFSNSVDLTIGVTNIALCQGFVTSPNLLAWGYKCETGYAPLKLSSGTVIGCVSCFGAASATTNKAVTGYDSCTAPIIPSSEAVSATNAALTLMTLVTCRSGYYYAGDGLCVVFANAVTSSAQITAC